MKPNQKCKIPNSFTETNLELQPIKEFSLNWDLLHARLSSHYKAWSYKKKKHKKIAAYRKSV